MNNVNSIVICRDTYNSQEEFENAIKDAVMVLLNNNYIMAIRYDDKGLGIVVIDYNNADRKFGTSYPYWLEPEEYESIMWNDNDDEGIK